MWRSGYTCPKPRRRGKTHSLFLLVSEVADRGITHFSTSVFLSPSLSSLAFSPEKRARLDGRRGREKGPFLSPSLSSSYLCLALCLSPASLCLVPFLSMSGDGMETDADAGSRDTAASDALSMEQARAGSFFSLLYLHTLSPPTISPYFFSLSLVLCHSAITVYLYLSCGIFISHAFAKEKELFTSR